MDCYECMATGILLYQSLVNNRMYDQFKIIRATDLDLQKNP